MRHKTPLPLAALLFTAAAAAPAAAQPVTFRAIPHGLDTTEFYPVSLSNDGLHVGGYYGDDQGIYFGFRWTDSGGAGAFLQFPDLCPLVPATRLFKLSGSGNAAVGEMNWCDQDPGCPGCGETGSGIWTEEHGTTFIGLLPGGVSDFEGSIAMGVSFDGAVAVGFSNTIDWQTGEPTLHAYRWTRPGGIEDLGMPENAQYSRAIGVSDDGRTILIDALMLLLDDEGEIVATPNLAFLWREVEGVGVFEPLPVPEGFESLIPTAISGDGATVVGVAATAFGVQPRRSETFRWRADTGTVLLGARPDLGRPQSVPWKVSVDGSVIVGDLTGANPRIPFVWTESDGFRPVTEILTAGGADYSGWSIRAVSAVSADGRTLIGWGFVQHPEYGTVVDGWIATLHDDTPPPPCPADWNNDDAVNSTDLSAFITSWLDSVQNGNLTADFNADGEVNSTDLSAFITAWLHAVQHGC